MRTHRLAGDEGRQDNDAAERLLDLESREVGRGAALDSSQEQEHPRVSCYAPDRHRIEQHASVPG